MKVKNGVPLDYLPTVAWFWLFRAFSPRISRRQNFNHNYYNDTKINPTFKKTIAVIINKTYLVTGPKKNRPNFGIQPFFIPQSKRDASVPKFPCRRSTFSAFPQLQGTVGGPKHQSRSLASALWGKPGILRQLGCPGTEVIHLLAIDPNFQRDIQVVNPCYPGWVSPPYLEDLPI